MTGGVRLSPLASLRRAAVTAAFLLSAAPTLAAPICADRPDGTVACRTASAAPRRGAPSPAPDADRAAQVADDAGPANVFGLACVIGGLFLLIGLMPDFDGWGPGDEGDRDAAED